MYIQNVAEGSAAFIANVLSGDVVIEVNGTPVIEKNQFQKVVADAISATGTLTFKVLRNGTEKLIPIPISAP